MVTKQALSRSMHEFSTTKWSILAYAGTWWDLGAYRGTDDALAQAHSDLPPQGNKTYSLHLLNAAATLTAFGIIGKLPLLVLPLPSTTAQGIGDVHLKETQETEDRRFSQLPA